MLFSSGCLCSCVKLDTAIDFHFVSHHVIKSKFMLLFVGCPLTSTITELNEVLDYLDKRIRHHLGIFLLSESI